MSMIHDGYDRLLNIMLYIGLYIYIYIWVGKQCATLLKSSENHQLKLLKRHDSSEIRQLVSMFIQVF